MLKKAAREALRNLTRLRLGEAEESGRLEEWWSSRAFALDVPLLPH